MWPSLHTSSRSGRISVTRPSSTWTSRPQMASHREHVRRWISLMGASLIRVLIRVYRSARINVFDVVAVGDHAQEGVEVGAVLGSQFRPQLHATVDRLHRK